MKLNDHQAHPLLSRTHLFYYTNKVHLFTSSHILPCLQKLLLYILVILYYHNLNLLPHYTLYHAMASYHILYWLLHYTGDHHIYIIGLSPVMLASCCSGSPSSCACVHDQVAVMPETRDHLLHLVLQVPGPRADRLQLGLDAIKPQADGFVDVEQDLLKIPKK